MTDTYTLNVDATTDDAQAKVDALVAELEARAVEVPVALAEPDMSAVDTSALDVDPVEVESSVATPDTSGFKSALDDVDSRADQSRSVTANLTGNVAGELAEVAGAAGPTGVALGQLAEYAADGNISLTGLAKQAGPMLALTAAVEIGTRAWAAYTAKTKMTEETTRKVSEALSDQDTALAGVNERLDELVDTDAASAFDRLNKALLEGLDEEEVTKVVGALGDLGMTVDDLAPSMAALEADTGDLRTGMEGLAQAGGIPPEFVANIAEAVHAGEDMGEITDALRDSLMAGGMSFEDAASKAEELSESYESQIRAMEQLNDAQQNSDFDDIAEEQLKLARGADLATQALVAQAESDLGPDATALEVWSRYIELQNEAAVAAEDAAAAAEESAKAAEGAAEFADAIASVDWQRAELDGAAAAMSDYSAALFEAGNTAQAKASAYAELGAAIGDVGLQFDQTTEAGFAQQDAMESLAGVVDDQLVGAFDAANGSFDTFKGKADAVRGEVIATLINDLGLTADEANKVADALGLTEGDYQARFELAGAEAATAQLALLSGSLDGLPDDIQRQVEVQILAGDPQGALDTMQAFYAENYPEVIAQVGADIDEFENVADDAIAEAEGRTAVIPVGADPADAEDVIEDVEDGPYDATVVTDADTDDADADVRAFLGVDRPVPVYLSLKNTLPTRQVIDSVAADRTATINANANTADAENELNHTARTRTSYVNQIVRTFGSSSSSGSSGRAAPATTAAPVVAPSIVINAAVVGDRYDVQRVVRRALVGSVRLGGTPR